MELERQRRICLSLWAYAYEFKNNSLVSDETFDIVAKQVDTSISTNKPELDAFFRQEFDAYTGQWIHKHPELHLIKQLYSRLYV